MSLFVRVFPFIPLNVSINILSRQSMQHSSQSVPLGYDLASSQWNRVPVDLRAAPFVKVD